MKLQLGIGMAANLRTWPIFDGRVKAEGIDLLPSPVFASELFWRQLKFDVSHEAVRNAPELRMARASRLSSATCRAPSRNFGSSGSVPEFTGPSGPPCG